MKRFYIAIILFTLPIFVFMGGAEYAIRQIPNEYKYKNDWMNQHAEEVETLIFGSSHGKNNIDPSKLDGLVYNMAFPSQSPKYDWFLLKKWGARYKNLKIIIVPISYFTFFYDEPFGSPQVPSYYRNYMDCPYHQGISSFVFELFFFKALHYKIVSLQNNHWKPECDDHGFYGLENDNKDERWGTLLNRSKSLVESEEGSLQYVESNLKFLCCMAEFCKEHCVQMVLVTTPTWRTFNKEFDKGRVAVIHQQIKTLQRKFGLLYLNYCYDSKFTKEDFYDLHHLNSHGAAKFSKMLNQDIRKYQ